MLSSLTSFFVAERKPLSFIDSLVVGDRVECRDAPDDEWDEGTVEAIDAGEVKVRKDGFQDAYVWDELRPLSFGGDQEVGDDIHESSDTSSHAEVGDDVPEFGDDVPDSDAQIPESGRIVREFLPSVENIFVSEVIDSVNEWIPEVSDVYSLLDTVPGIEDELKLSILSNPEYTAVARASLSVFQQNGDSEDLLDTLRRIVSVKNYHGFDESKIPAADEDTTSTPLVLFFAPPTILFFEQAERIRRHLNLPLGLPISELVDAAEIKLGFQAERWAHEKLSNSETRSLRMRMDTIAEALPPPKSMLFFEIVREVKRQFNLSSELSATETVKAVGSSLGIEIDSGLTLRHKYTYILSQILVTSREQTEV